MLYSLRERTTRLGLLCLLLFLSLGLTVLVADATVQQVQSFQREEKAVKKQDVNAIHPWMTVHVVSHIYHVPEDYLYSSLRISANDPLRHATLSTIASHEKQPYSRVAYTLKSAILAYQKAHPKILTPTPTSTPHPQNKDFIVIPIVGRTNY
jgi:hypothetical protein